MSALPDAAESPQPNLRLDPAHDLTPLGLNFWSMLIATGVAAGLVGGLLMKLLYAVEQTAFHYNTGGFLDGVRNSSSARKLTVLLLAGVFAGAAGWFASRMRGDTDLNGAVWTRSGRLPLLKAAVKALYSIITVGLGAAVGRENALKQAGGILANLTATWRNLPDDQRRLLVACGGGAGMAAAYNVPLGGAVFAMEVLLGSFSLRTVMPALATSMLAVWTSWLLLPNAPTYSIQITAPSLAMVLWALAVGPVCGLVAVPFIRLVGWAKTAKPQGWQIAVFPVLSLGLLGLLSLHLPSMLGNGKDVIELTLLNAPSTRALLLLLILRPVATALILRSGVPGGLFTPTMSLGAVTGLLLGRGAAVLLPRTALPQQLPTCALIGSAAVLAAATQGPLSSIAFVLELTHTADTTMVPILIAVVLATIVVRRFEKRSIYSIEAGEKA